MEAMEARSRDEDEARRLLSPEDKINRCLPQKKKKKGKEKGRELGERGRDRGEPWRANLTALQPPPSPSQPHLAACQQSRGGSTRPRGKTGGSAEMWPTSRVLVEEQRGQPHTGRENPTRRQKPEPS